MFTCGNHGMCYPIVLMQHFNLFIPFIYGSIVIVFVTLVVCRAALSPSDADDFLKSAMRSYVEEQDYKADKAALLAEFAATEYSRSSRSIRIYKPPPPTGSVHICICICIPICIHIRTCTHTRTCICIRICIRIFACVHTHIRM